jgi:hypothetical protein
MAHIGKSTRAFDGSIRAGLLAVALLLAVSFDANAVDCSDYTNGLLDGSAGTVAPSQMNAGVLLTFDNFPIVPAGRQIIVELTVILDNSPTNAPGTQFVNTAKRDFDTFEVETQ